MIAHPLEGGDPGIYSSTSHCEEAKGRRGNLLHSPPFGGATLRNGSPHSARDDEGAGTSLREEQKREVSPPSHALKNHVTFYTFVLLWIFIKIFFKVFQIL